MKKILLAQFLVFSMVIANAQDTLTYSGLIMTPIDEVSRLSTGGYFVWDLFNAYGLLLPWFPVDTTLNYLAALDKEVFITKCYWGKEFGFYFKNEHVKKFQCTGVIKKELGCKSAVYDSYLLPSGPYFKKYFDGIYYYVLEVEFKYVFFEKLDINMYNLNAKTEKESFIKKNVQTNFILEILSMKPYKK